MTLADELRAVPILAGFTDEQVAQLAAAGEETTVRRPAPTSSTRGVRRTTGGCFWTGASTWCVGSATRTWSWRRWSTPASGPAASRRGTSTASTWGRRRVMAPSRVFRAVLTGARSPRRGVVPLRRPPPARPDRHRPSHRGRRPPARGPRRPRHAGRRAGARDQQPGLRRRPLGRRTAAVERRRLRLPRNDWRGQGSTPTSSSRSTSCGARSTRRQPRPGSRCRTSRRS